MGVINKKKLCVRYPPDGLLPLELQGQDVAHQLEDTADLFSSDELNHFVQQENLLQSTTTDEKNIMSKGDNDLVSGLNGRLRPRKSNVLIPSNLRASRKSDVKPTTSPKSTPSKGTPAKNDDLATKSDDMPTFQLLCPYCDRKFTSKEDLSKHVRRTHIPALKQNTTIACIFCNHDETNLNEIIRHMVDDHPNHYFACLDCNSRFISTPVLAEHRLYVCEKQKPIFSTKIRPKKPKQDQKSESSAKKDYRTDVKEFPDGHGFNGIVISCELKPAQVHDEADIEDNITTNLILPPNKTLSNAVMEKNAVIVLDDIQWTRRLPPNFSFHNADADQILSRLGVVHKSPRGGESTKKDWFKIFDEANQKFERCFDTTFYAKVASNVQENLNKFLDGTFNFNPDPDAMIKTRKSKYSVAINTAEGFPILLASAQFTRNVFERYIPRSIAPKHKWKWDSIESDRNALNPDQIKRDSHTNSCIITLVSGLDIWTQLRMKCKFDDKFNNTPVGKKIEKQNAINLELKEILESRDVPSTSSKIAETSPPKRYARESPPSWLGLSHTKIGEAPPPAVLSGEWVRPRCYVCCACGEQTRDPRDVSSHINTYHPNAQVQHYEIVGDRLLKSDILKHLYVPPGQIVSRTRPIRGFRDCTKCNKAISIEELHQHMLECAGDSPTVRRKVRPRPFGTRRRRPRIPDNTMRTKIRKHIKPRHSNHHNRLRRTRPKIRSEVGDAESIRKMIADLPAKRHRVTLNPDNSIIRPQRSIDKQRNKLILRRRGTEELRHRRLRAVRSSASSFTETPVTTDDSNQKNEEEDTTPLKPRPPRMSTRRLEAIKANKRKAFAGRSLSVPIRTLMYCEPTDGDNIPPLDEPTDGNQGSCQSSDNNKNISQRGDMSSDSSGGRQQGRHRTPTQAGPNNTIENTPERINMGGASSSNDRQHGRRGTPTRGGRVAPQRSGDGMNRGGEAPSRNGNNDPTPQRTPPLKHSIARLCGNLETHDKSVQFQPMFLIQQECNNAPHHVPTGQQLLFENEAIVTKLDKPPIYDYKGGTDERTIDVSLKSKQNNKPRKGLNDCIAMLKNKLVEPAPVVNQEHVSVQCGNDEPIEKIATPPVLPNPKVLYFESPMPCPPINSIDQVRCIDTMDKAPNNDLSKFGYNMTMPIPAMYTTPFIQQIPPQDPIFKPPPKRGAKTYTAPPKKRAVQVLPRRESIRRKAAIRAESEIQKQKYSELAAQIQAFTPKYSDFCAVKQIVPPKHYKSPTMDKPPKTVQKLIQAQMRAQDKIKALEAFVRPMEPLSVKTSDKARVLESNVHHQNNSTYNARYNTSNHGLPKKMRAASIPRNMDPNNLLPDKSVMRRYSLDITSQYNINTQLSPQLQVHNMINHSPKEYSQHSPREANYRILHSPSQGKVNMSPIDEAFWHYNPNRGETDVSPRLQYSPNDNISRYNLSANYNQTFHSPNELYSSLHFEKDVMSGVPSSSLTQYSRRDSNSDKDSHQSYEESQAFIPSPMSLPRSAYPLGQQYSELTSPLDLSGKSEVLDMTKQLMIEEQLIPVPNTEESGTIDITQKSSQKEVSIQEKDKDEPAKVVDLRVKTQITTGKRQHDQTRENYEKHNLPTEKCFNDMSDGYEGSLTAVGLANSAFLYSKPSYRLTDAVQEQSPQIPSDSIKYIDDAKDLRQNIENETSINATDSPKRHSQVEIVNHDIESKIYKTEKMLYDDLTVVTPQYQMSAALEPLVEDTSEEINIIDVSQVPVTSPPAIALARQPITYPISELPLSYVKSTCEVFENSPTDNMHPKTMPQLSKIENTEPELNSEIETSSVVTRTLPSTQTTIVQTLPENHNKDTSGTNLTGNHDKSNTEFASNPKAIDIDQDPEVAKKIELLPRELVEIIGNMPPDHRNKLLNVLPQYVSTSTSIQEKVKEQTVTIFTSANTDVDHCSHANKIPSETSDLHSIPIIKDTIKEELSFKIPPAGVKEEFTPKVQDYKSIRNNVIDLTNDDAPITTTETVEREPNSTNAILKSTVNTISINPTSKLKSNNEQTASLRAVRIKPALERNKTTSIKPLVIEKSLLESIPVDNTVTKRTPPVQQAVVSRSQQNFTNTVTNTLSVISPNQSINLKHLSAYNNNNNDQIKTKDMDLNLAEESLKDNENSILSTTSNEKVETQQIIENNLTVGDITPKEQQTSTEQIKDDDSQKTLKMNENKPNEANDSFLNSTPIENCLPLNNSTPKPSEELAHEQQLQLQVATPAPMNDTNDNDSEDDISLALIVKQRRKSMVITKPNENINTSDVSSKKIIKKRKTKKTTSFTLDNNLKSCTESKMLSNTECLTALNCEEEIEMNIRTENVSRKNNKRLKKKSNVTQNRPLDNIPQELSDNTNILNNCASGALSSESRMDINNDDKLTNVFNSTEDKVVTQVEIISRDTHKSSSLLINTISNYNKSNLDIGSKHSMAEKRNEHSMPQQNDDPEKLLLCNELSEIPAEIKNISGDSGTNITETSSKNSNEMQTSFGDETFDEVLSQNTKDYDNKSPILLRRSKRGKSLFMDIPEVSHKVSDAKAPLTKKQLIFSKLLHDESCKLNQSLNIEPQNDSVIDATNSYEDFNATTEIKISEEKLVKSTKRKMSQQLKQNIKKNKTDRTADALPDAVLDSKTSEEHDKEVNFSSQDNEHVLEEKESSKEVIDDKFLHSPIKSDKAENENMESSIGTDSKTLASAEKRKIEINLTEYSIQKPKKLKTSKDDDDEFINVAHYENKTSEMRSTCYSQAITGNRQTRSKHYYLNSSISDTYDPYDMDLDEMIENPEPCKKKKMRSKVGNLKHTKRPSKTKLKVKTIQNTTTTNADQPKTDSAEADSDSSQSDIPLKKYVKDKEVLSNKRQKLKTNLKIDNRKSDDSIHDKQEIPNVQTDTDEQLRSEQFMESFGFFSERKPRKSNLLATKKISETFQQENDTKKRDDKKKTNKETKKFKNGDKTASLTSAPKQSTSVNKKGEQTNEAKAKVACYCFYCKQIFRRPDNYLRHQISKYHISKLAETDLKFDTDFTLDTTNHLVVFKQELDKQMLHKIKSQSDMQSKQTLDQNNKKSKKLKQNTQNLKEILDKVYEIVKEEDLRMKDQNRDEILFLNSCKLLKAYRQKSAVKVYLDNNTIGMCPLEPANASQSNDGKNDGGTESNSVQNKLAQTKDNDVKKELEEQAKNKLTQQQEQFEKSTLVGTLMDMTKIRALCGADYTLDNLPKIIHPKRPQGPIAYSDKIMIPRRKVSGGPQRSNKSIGTRSRKGRNTSARIVKRKTLKNEPKPGTSRHANAQLSKIGPSVKTKTGITKLTASQPKKKRKKRTKCESGPGTSKKSDKTATTPNLSESVNNGDKIEQPIDYPEYKEKMYPDIVIEDIDMLEDKFDKIKRKCRSQAAAAKQTPPVVECISTKSRKKADKKKIKKKAKKSHHSSTVLTKGALKGFDGIKISVTSDINMSDIARDTTPKKKKKSSSKKKREQRNSDSSNKSDNDHRANNLTSQKKVDVYEFLDNEDAELFEFRPSTLMERFKSMSTSTSTKDNVNTSEPRVTDVDITSENGSDDDDFVYMSDDYVCSDDETENSLLSCELGNNKNNFDAKKIISPVKRKETVDKSAVMGKIFKNNAVRSDKKIAKSKETVKSKTNLDQLFDSLLKNEQEVPVDEDIKTKTGNENSISKEDGKKPEESSPKTFVETSTQYEPLLIETEATSKKEESTITKLVSSLPLEKLSTSTALTTTSRRNTSISPRIRAATPKIIENYSLTNSPNDDPFSRISQDLFDDIHAPSTSRKYSISPPKEFKHLSRKLDFLCTTFESLRNQGRASRYDNFPLREANEFPHQKYSSKKPLRLESSSKDEGSYSDMMEDGRDDAGVAPQRARRKCTVGKQNVLAESWSSESDADGAPRTASATSVAAAAVRRKKAKRRDAASAGRRKGQGPSKKSEEFRISTPPCTDWTEDTEEHVQQHGWIVGDSHKKLVTMLAHAKGRKRTTDDDLD